MGAAGDRFLRLVTQSTTDPAMLEETVRIARATSDVVADLPEEEVRRHSRALLDGVRAALADGGHPGEEVLSAAERLGSDRARQGVPLAAILDGYQACRSYLVETVVAEGRRLGVPADALLDGVTQIGNISIPLVHRMVHGHRAAALDMARTTRDRHMQMLRQLLHGEETAPARAPLDPSATYHCVVSDVSDPAVAGLLETAFTATGPGLCGLVDGRFAALVGRLPTLPADASLLVAAPPALLADVAPLYALARRALQAAKSADLTGFHSLTDLALLTVTHAGSDLGRLLSDSLLGELRPNDAFHRELAGTALAYLDKGGRIEQTAAALHVHGNTVKYRLRRLRELVGASPVDADTVEETAHWWWALRTWLGR
ncbi:helix-turn-helix domain-containing protein [Streptomyces sp. NPDC058175]|uniref:helix-turn-helix domain-containing protein n=1 Tax=Streptomyces sp. NPDC058175 TaxID=3346367 RepID=UPI0036EDF5F5